jgi:hypothetical protein
LVLHGRRLRAGHALALHIGRLQLQPADEQDGQTDEEDDAG